jgi:hypothetical protein
MLLLRISDHCSADKCVCIKGKKYVRVVQMKPVRPAVFARSAVKGFHLNDIHILYHAACRYVRYNGAVAWFYIGQPWYRQ